MRIRNTHPATLLSGLLVAILLPGAAALPALAVPEGTEKKQLVSAPRPEERVDLNHASLQELMKVPGLTQSWAGRIIRFRPYRAKNELVDRGVVTGEVYERIKDYVIAHQKPN